MFYIFRNVNNTETIRKEIFFYREYSYKLEVKLAIILKNLYLPHYPQNEIKIVIKQSLNCDNLAIMGKDINSRRNSIFC